MAEHFAAENRSIDQVLELRSEYRATILRILREVGPYCSAGPGARILELGTAQGLYVNVLTEAGYDACGIEPWPAAVETSRELERRTGVKTEVIEAWAEQLPFEDDEFDFVFALSVMEHVRDPIAVFREAHRVLRRGGGFWFHTTSALARRQAEIAGFPLFPWYPAPIKRRIMNWAAEKRPELVGGTTAPAIHWFTPWGVRRDLRAAGFDRVVERWDLKSDEQFDGWRRVALRAARRSRPVRLAGEFLVPGSGYLGLKAAS